MKKFSCFFALLAMLFVGCNKTAVPEETFVGQDVFVGDWIMLNPTIELKIDADTFLYTCEDDKIEMAYTLNRGAVTLTVQKVWKKFMGEWELQDGSALLGQSHSYVISTSHDNNLLLLSSETLFLEKPGLTYSEFYFRQGHLDNVTENVLFARGVWTTTFPDRSLSINLDTDAKTLDCIMTVFPVVATKEPDRVRLVASITPGTGSMTADFTELYTGKNDGWYPMPPKEIESLLGSTTVPMLVLQHYDFLCCRVAEQAFVFSRSSMNWPQLKTPIGTWGHNTYGQSVVVDIKNASSKWQMSYFTQGEDLKIQTSVYNISQWGLTNNDRPCMFLSGKTIDETYTPLSEGTNFTYDISNDGNALAITDDALPTLVYRLTTMPSGEEQIEGYWLGGSSAYGWAGVNVSNGMFLFYASDHRFEATLNAYQGGHASITINRYIEVTTDGHGHTQETEIEFQDLDAHKWPGLRGTVDVPIYRMGKLPGSSDEWTYLMYPSGDGSNELIRLVRLQ